MDFQELRVNAEITLNHVNKKLSRYETYQESSIENFMSSLQSRLELELEKQLLKDFIKNCTDTLNLSEFFYNINRFLEYHNWFPNSSDIFNNAYKLVKGKVYTKFKQEWEYDINKLLKEQEEN